MPPKQPVDPDESDDDLSIDDGTDLAIPDNVSNAELLTVVAGRLLGETSQKHRAAAIYVNAALELLKGS